MGNEGNGTGEATVDGGALIERKLSCRILLTIVPLPDPLRLGLSGDVAN